MDDKPAFAIKAPGSPWLAALLNFTSLALLGTIIYQMVITFLVHYSGMKAEDLTDLLSSIQSMAVTGVFMGWIFLTNLNKGSKILYWSIASVALALSVISIFVGVNPTAQDTIVGCLILMWIGLYLVQVTRLNRPMIRLLTYAGKLSKGSRNDLFAARKVLRAIADAKRGTPPDLYHSVGDLEEEIYHTILNLIKFLESIDQLTDYCTASSHDKTQDDEGKTAHQRAQTLLNELNGKVNKTLELLREVQGWVVITCTEAKAQSQVGGDFSEKVAEIKQQLKFQFEAMEEINQKLGS
jgi:hypothetical protein